MNLCFHTVSAVFVFNKDVRAVDPGSSNEDTSAFIQAVITLFDNFTRVGFEPPVYRIFPTKQYRDMTGAIKELYGYGKKHVEELQAEGHKVDGAMGLLEQWLREGKLSKESAIVMSIDMFGAGVDTVSVCT